MTTRTIIPTTISVKKLLGVNFGSEVRISSIGGVPLPNTAKSSVASANEFVRLQIPVPKVPSFSFKAYTKYSSFSLNQYPLQEKVLKTVFKTICFSFEPFHHCEVRKDTIVL